MAIESEAAESVKVIVLKVCTNVSSKKRTQHGIVIHSVEDDEAPIKFDESEMVGDVARIIADECGIDNDTQVGLMVNTASEPCKAGALIGEAINVGDYVVDSIESGTAIFDKSPQSSGGAFNKVPQQDYVVSARNDLMQPPYVYEGSIPCYKADYFRPQPGQHLSSPCCSDAFKWFKPSSSS